MDNGNIKELGTHDELIKLNGIYSNMYQTQAQYYNWIDYRDERNIKLIQPHQWIKLSTHKKRKTA